MSCISVLLSKSTDTIDLQAKVDQSSYFFFLFILFSSSPSSVKSTLLKCSFISQRNTYKPVRDFGWPTPPKSCQMYLTVNLGVTYIRCYLQLIQCYMSWLDFLHFYFGNVQKRVHHFSIFWLLRHSRACTEYQTEPICYNTAKGINIFVYSPGFKLLHKSWHIKNIWYLDNKQICVFKLRKLTLF